MVLVLTSEMVLNPLSKVFLEEERKKKSGTAAISSDTDQSSFFEQLSQSDSQLDFT